LLICDSAGGESLGQLVSANDPSPYEWRRFELVRFVTKPGGIRIHLETRGQVQAFIAEMSAEMIIPTTQAGVQLSEATYNPSESDGERGLPVNASRPQAGGSIRQPYTQDQ
jgi:hypothetical protein